MFPRDGRQRLGGTFRPRRLVDRVDPQTQARILAAHQANLQILKTIPAMDRRCASIAFITVGLTVLAGRCRPARIRCIALAVAEPASPQTRVTVPIDLTGNGQPARPSGFQRVRDQERLRPSSNSVIKTSPTVRPRTARCKGQVPPKTLRHRRGHAASSSTSSAETTSRRARIPAPPAYARRDRFRFGFQVRAAAGRAMDACLRRTLHRFRTARRF